MGASCSSLSRILLPDRRRKPTPRPGLGKYILEPDRKARRKPRRKRPRVGTAHLHVKSSKVSLHKQILEPISTLKPVASKKRLRFEFPQDEAPAPELKHEEPVPPGEGVVETAAEVVYQIPEHIRQIEENHFAHTEVKGLSSEWCSVLKA